MASGVACVWAEALPALEWPGKHPQTPKSMRLRLRRKWWRAIGGLIVFVTTILCLTTVSVDLMPKEPRRVIPAPATHSPLTLTTKPPASSPTKQIEKQKAKKYMPAASESILLPPPPPTVTTASAQSVAKRKQDKARTFKRRAQKAGRPVLPAGDYLDTCANCVAHGTTAIMRLECKCCLVDVSHCKWDASLVLTPSKCPEVQNSKGTLQCITADALPSSQDSHLTKSALTLSKGSPSAFEQLADYLKLIQGSDNALPIGQYTSSCVGCTGDNRHVKCICCFRADGECVPTAVLEVDASCGDVENSNGGLVCSHTVVDTTRVTHVSKKLLSRTHQSRGSKE